MPFDQIIDKIKDDANIKLAEIREEYQIKTKEFDRKYLEKIKKIQNENKIKAENLKNNVREQLLSKGRMALKIRLLTEKGQILNDVFNKAFEKIKNLPENDYANLFKKQVDNLKLTSGEIHIGRDDFNKLNKYFADYKKGFEIKNDDTFSNGIVVKVGRVQYDFRLSRIFEELKDNLEDRIAKMLFG